MTEKVEVNDLYYKDKVKALGRIIREGGLVAFPTETVYGLGGNALDAGAAKKIYAAKGRPSDNPLIVHVADPSEVEKYAAEVSSLARRLMDTFWPGPLTIVFPKKDCIPMETSGGLSTIAIRCPRSEATRALIRAAGVPIAGPSANISTRPSPTTADDVLHDMNGRIAAVIDGGPCQIGLESTVVGIEGSAVCHRTDDGRQRTRQRRRTSEGTWHEVSPLCAFCAAHRVYGRGGEGGRGNPLLYGKDG